MNILTELPPDTSHYMIAGYIIIYSSIIIYVASLWIRYKKYSAQRERIKKS